MFKPVMSVRDYMCAKSADISLWRVGYSVSLMLTRLTFLVIVSDGCESDGVYMYAPFSLRESGLTT